MSQVDLNRVGVAALARRIAIGEITSEAVVRACLQRIEAREPTVHAWAYLDPALALTKRAIAIVRTSAGRCMAFRSELRTSSTPPTNRPHSDPLFMPVIGRTATPHALHYCVLREPWSWAKRPQQSSQARTRLPLQIR